MDDPPFPPKSFQLFGSSIPKFPVLDIPKLNLDYLKPLSSSYYLSQLQEDLQDFFQRPRFSFLKELEAQANEISRWIRLFPELGELPVWVFQQKWPTDTDIDSETYLLEKIEIQQAQKCGQIAVLASDSIEHLLNLDLHSNTIKWFVNSVDAIGCRISHNSGPLICLNRLNLLRFFENIVSHSPKDDETDDNLSTLFVQIVSEIDAIFKGGFFTTIKQSYYEALTRYYIPVSETIHMVENGINNYIASCDSHDAIRNNLPPQLYQLFMFIKEEARTPSDIVEHLWPNNVCGYGDAQAQTKVYNLKKKLKDTGLSVERLSNPTRYCLSEK